MDWRITNQENYLMGVHLKHKEFYPKTPNDHAHCEFCWYTFTDGTIGYATFDEKHWICDKCYHDFRKMFQWRVT